jgi:GH24 family phage-related lysozyme (muramidase)
VADRFLLFGCILCLIETAESVAADLDRDKLRSQLIKHEGKRTKVYKDTEGIPTIGVGFNLNLGDAKKRIEALGLNFEKVKAGTQELTESHISKLLDADIDSAIADCKSVFPKFEELSDARQRVLADMMFNLGTSRFEQFKKMIAHVKGGGFAKAADEMKASKWYEQVKDRGKTLERMMRTGKD